MLDMLDREIIKLLITGEMSGNELVQLLPTECTTGNEKQTWMKVTYRLKRMVHEKFVKYNKKTHTYTLENVTWGAVVIDLLKEDGEVERLLGGRAIFIHLKDPNMTRFEFLGDE
jgi:RIO-like serine/threonine protein kinase